MYARAYVRTHVSIHIQNVYNPRLRAHGQLDKAAHVAAVARARRPDAARLQLPALPEPPHEVREGRQRADGEGRRLRAAPAW